MIQYEKKNGSALLLRILISFQSDEPSFNINLIKCEKYRYVAHHCFELKSINSYDLWPKNVGKILIWLIMAILPVKMSKKLLEAIPLFYLNLHRLWAVCAWCVCTVHYTLYNVHLALKSFSLYLFVPCSQLKNTDSWSHDIFRGFIDIKTKKKHF